MLICRRPSGVYIGGRVSPVDIQGYVWFGAVCTELAAAVVAYAVHAKARGTFS